jgi:hypothetical protein
MLMGKSGAWWRGESRVRFLGLCVAPAGEVPVLELDLKLGDRRVFKPAC